MDGTFIPLAGNEQNRSDLHTLQAELERHEVTLMYVTGRHLELVLDAIRSDGLPSPRWMICDVGASIYHVNSTGVYTALQEYTQHLSDLVGEHSRATLVQQVGEIAGLRMQEPEKQTEFKISYYCNADNLTNIETLLMSELERSCAPYRIIASVDPFTGDGLIDFLPAGVSKAYALRWWAGHTQSEHQSIVFAGDSGNDIAALTAGYRSIVVGNAEKAIATEVRRVHELNGWSDRLVVSTSLATSGVLEGLKHFLKR